MSKKTGRRLVLIAVVATVLSYLLFEGAVRQLAVDLSRPAITDLLFAPGDQAEWKQADWPLNDWSSSFPCGAERYWWAAEVVIDSGKAERPPLGLGIRSFLGAYEVYWDGHFIGRNGQINTAADIEQPGAIDRVFLLPDFLSGAGPHRLSVRVSQQYDQGHCNYPFIKLNNYDTLSQTLIIIAAFMHLLAGGFLVIGLYYLFIYLKSYRQLPFLFFSLFCFFLFGWIVLEYIKFYYAYPYPWHYVRLDTISWLAVLSTLSISTFFVFLFSTPARYYWLGAQVLLISGVWFYISDYDLRNFYFVNVSLVISTAVLVFAMVHRRDLALESLLSLLPLGIASFYFYPFIYDICLFLAFTLFILLSLYNLSKFIGRQRQAYERGLHQLNLLKVALLKRNIQPHYLLNTLTSLISWVEESPRVAIQFIEALAEEFNRLREVSEKEFITMQEEVALCQSHLKVMSFRDERSYQMQTEGIESDEKIPPAIFLTLVENGLTHNRMEKKEITFKLSIRQERMKRVYTFLAPGKVMSSQPKATGTGLKYVQARLKQAYGESWRMENGVGDGGWQTRIEIF